MNLKTLLRSFAGGEITPELFGRLDLVKFQTGLDTALNFTILAHGPAVNRAGTEYVNETKDSSKKSVLVPFIYSTTQSYVLEFGDQYMRIHTNGATVLEATKAITGATQANPGVITAVAHGYSVGQWVYVSGVVGMTQLNGRYFKVGTVPTADTFTLTDFAGVAINTTGYGAYASGGTTARVYEISTPYLEADLFDLHFTQSADVLTIVHPTYQQRELKRLGATNWTLSTFTLAPTLDAPTGATATVGSGAGAVTYAYVCTAVASDGLEESLISNEATVNNDLTGAGAYNNITCTLSTGAVRFKVYKKLNGLYGYIGQANAAATFKDNNITPDLSKTPPEANDPFVGANNYPGAVGYYKGRRWFGGTNIKPQNIWATRAGTEKNMTYSIPTRDDDSIGVRPTARRADTVRHIVPANDLLVLTSATASNVQPVTVDGDGEWQITSENSDAITPTSISYKAQVYSALYGAARGGRLHEMRYAWENGGYKTNDLSIMVPHLADGYAIKSLAYAAAPNKLVWAVRDDGTLLGLTYVPQHEVIGWHKHTTDGSFEAVQAVPEGSEDATYFVVKRTINGRTVRVIERLHTRKFSTLADAFFVDCGLTYSGAATTSIAGLHHLEGKTVSILADGAVHPQKVVTNGAITLDQAASKVHVGLQITADLKTLPLTLEAAQAAGKGGKQNVSRVVLLVNESSGIKVGPSFSKLTPFKQRTTEPYGSPPALYTGEIEVVVQPSWGASAAVCVRQADPLPVTVSSMSIEVTASN